MHLSLLLLFLFACTMIETAPITSTPPQFITNQTVLNDVDSLAFNTNFTGDIFRGRKRRATGTAREPCPQETLKSDVALERYEIHSYRGKATALKREPLIFSTTCRYENNTCHSCTSSATACQTTFQGTRVFVNVVIAADGSLTVSNKRKIKLGLYCKCSKVRLI